MVQKWNVSSLDIGLIGHDLLFVYGIVWRWHSYAFNFVSDFFFFFAVQHLWFFFLSDASPRFVVPLNYMHFSIEICVLASSNEQGTHVPCALCGALFNELQLWRRWHFDILKDRGKQHKYRTIFVIGKCRLVNVCWFRAPFSKSKVSHPISSCIAMCANWGYKCCFALILLL